MMKDAAHMEEFFWWRVLQRSNRFFRFTFISLMVLIGTIALGILYLKSRPLPTPDIYSVSKIYDDQGNFWSIAAEGEEREPVSLKEIPRHLILATLAAEDQTFYDHFGFSLRGIARATWNNLKNGKVTQGASTITQQLARNLYLNHDRTWTRKWKEALLTVQLELHFTKDEILEMYLNEIYYGHGAYGIERAAKLYFGKKAKDLTLAESAFLAGIPRGPTIYSPYHHYSRIKQRQKHILELMVKNKMITEEEARKALAEQLVIVSPQKPKQLKANYFRDYVIQTAVNQYGLDERLVRHGGLKIYTTLNKEMQQKAEETVKQYLQDHGELQGALLAVEPQTGHIKAMVGGKDYTESQFNRVFAKRQPGSSFKPILYLTALENGFTPLTKIMSRPTTFIYDGGVYKPGNFGQSYPNRPISLREAIAKSDNIYAVTALLQIGIEKEIEMAKRLGIQSTLKPTPSLALGSYSVTPFEMTRAFATIASGGKQRPLIAITKIEDQDGTVLVDHTQDTEEKEVISPAHAYVLTQLLTSVLEPGGTGHRAKQIFHGLAAGKTGTTDWDGWLVGYTPNLVTTVWVGYDHSQELPVSKARLSQYIWGSFMEKVAHLYPNRIFPIPENVVSVYVDEETGLLATPHCKHVRKEYFVKGTEPTAACTIHDPPDPPDRSWLERLFDLFN